MDKKLIKVMILIWSFVAVVFTVLLVVCINKGDYALHYISFGSWGTPTKVQKQESTDIGNCTKIKLDFASADIVVASTDEQELKIVEKANGSMSKEEKFVISKDGDTVSVSDKGRRVGFYFWGLNNMRRIEVYIPKNYSKDLDIKTSSGDITFDSDIKLANLNCRQESGDFKSHYAITADQVNFVSSSGDINTDELTCKEYDVSASSGDIHINGLSGSGQVDSSSGDIRITYKDISESTKVSASSGDVTLEIPKSISFEFNGRCGSGDINSDFDLSYSSRRRDDATGKVGNGPYKKVDVNTQSGDINLR